MMMEVSQCVFNFLIIFKRQISLGQKALSDSGVETIVTARWKGQAPSNGLGLVPRVLGHLQYLRLNPSASEAAVTLSEFSMWLCNNVFVIWGSRLSFQRHHIYNRGQNISGMSVNFKVSLGGVPGRWLHTCSLRLFRLSFLCAADMMRFDLVS